MNIFWEVVFMNKKEKDEVRLMLLDYMKKNNLTSDQLIDYLRLNLK